MGDLVERVHGVLPSVRRDLEDLVRRAGLTALRRGLDSKEVSMADFEAALKETRASVTEEMLSDYDRIRETLKSDAVKRRAARIRIASRGSRHLPPWRRCPRPS